MPTAVEVTTPSDREIEVTRVFDAPQIRVFDCHTKPELVRRWMLGPPGWAMPVCEIDLTVGGRYRYVWRNDADGRQFGSTGEFREIAAPERLVNTEVMEGAPGEALNTTTFAEDGGRTTLRIRMLFDTKEIRDLALKSGMTNGMAISYDRLAAILDEQKTG